MTHPTIELVLFDLDGTLVDSATDLCACANWLRSCRGLPALALRNLRSSAGKGVRGLVWSALRIDAQSPAFAPLREQFLARYAEHMTDHCALFAGVTELLDELRARRIAYGIVTNKAGALARPICRTLGLLDGAACFVAGDEVAHLKPAPDSLRLALSRTAADPLRTVYVGDDARDAAAARAAGLRSIAALWGYLPEGADVSGWAVQACAAQPTDVLNAVDRLQSYRLSG